MERERIELNQGWIYNHNEVVDIPHTPSLIDYNYFDAKIFESEMHYSRKLFIPEDYINRTLILSFDGVAHYSKVFFNSELVYENCGGYSKFSVNITEYVKHGANNKIEVVVSASKDLNVPPFGGVIDYLTYGGIYRDVYLEIFHKYHIEDVFCYSEIGEEIKLIADIKLSEYSSELSLGIHQQGQFDDIIEVKKDTIHIERVVSDIELWDIENPRLYDFVVSLYNSNKLCDRVQVRIGYRKSEFTKDGFYLNSRKVDLIGLNRHQAYPYVGYAMPKSIQEYDAKILKEELKVNIVRTSHYPQSRYFYDKCDELGLLVFTEIPGWQHIGDDEWKERSLSQLEAMIREHRNHPSIITWGVRINESLDDDEFYTRTNNIARKLDHTRETTGVRYLKNSNLLEDIYSLNDFTNDGSGKYISDKSEVTDIESPYLISEHSGHMHPTKSYDNYETRLGQAKRHSETIKAALSADGISGAIGWCMNDYNTNHEFGSGDGICHHGVLDMFRNEKLAASVYKSYGKEPMLEITSSFHMGDVNGGVLSKVYAITNVDRVELYRNNMFIKSFENENNFIHMDDFIGDSIEDENLKRVINAMSMYTPLKLPEDILEIKKNLKETDDELYALYNKYIGGWGSKGSTYKFIGIKDHKEVVSRCFSRNIKPKMVVRVSSNILWDSHTYDAAAIRITVTDNLGNKLYYFDDVVTFDVEGEIEIIGPSVTHFRGGATGTYVKSKGIKSDAKLIISCRDMREEIEFRVVKHL